MSDEDSNETGSITRPGPGRPGAHRCHARSGRRPAPGGASAGAGPDRHGQRAGRLAVDGPLPPLHQRVRRGGPGRHHLHPPEGSHQPADDRRAGRSLRRGAGQPAGARRGLPDGGIPEGADQVRSPRVRHEGRRRGQGLRGLRLDHRRRGPGRPPPGLGDRLGRGQHAGPGPLEGEAGPQPRGGREVRRASCGSTPSPTRTTPARGSGGPSPASSTSSAPAATTPGRPGAASRARSSTSSPGRTSRWSPTTGSTSTSSTATGRWASSTPTRPTSWRGTRRRSST